ncbi:MAG: hypothetical protein H6570_09920 [Lewinellaceae bacterium]|nr:hypothetical protein [Lewinellaceae bacterium]
MRTFILLLFSCILFNECINTNQHGKNIYDGAYCAEVTYYNPNTGRESEYTLTIVVDDNELDRINFPNGHLGNDHYEHTEFDWEGYLNFTSERGYEYSVQIIGEASGCYDDLPKAIQCLGITKDGSRCKRLTDNPSGYCWQHERQED